MAFLYKILLVMSKMILKTLEDVDKPALAGLWPNNKGMNVVLDLGQEDYLGRLSGKI